MKRVITALPCTVRCRALLLALLAPILSGLVPMLAQAQVAFDAATTSLNKVNLSTATFSHTTSGTNRALIVHVQLNGTAQTVSSITYAGTNLALIGVEDMTNPPTERLELWGLAAPASGANDVVVTLSASNSAWDAAAISFTGADQTGGTATFNGFIATHATTNVNTLSVTVTSGGTNDMIFAGAGSGENNLTTVSGTQRWRDNTGTTNFEGQTAPGASPNVVMTQDWSANGDSRELAGVNITASGGAPPPAPHQLPTLGCCLLSINWVNLLAWEPCGMQTDCSFTYRVCEQTNPASPDSPETSSGRGIGARCIDLPPGSDALDVSFVKKTATGESIISVGSVTLTVTAP